MTPERWRQITEIFDATIAREPAARDRFVREACHDDDALRAAVDDLLSAHGKVGAFGDTPIAPPVSVLTQSTSLDDADEPTDQPEPAGTSPNRVRRDSAMSRRAARTSGPLEVGQAFGLRYHISSLLGMGGMGAVYQAWDAELGVSVALKVIRPEIVADAFAAGDIERRFKRELLLARQITHKNVVRIHDLGEIDGIKYITMPLVDGSDLATLLKKETTLPIRRALQIARGVVAGLACAHHAGVVHCDLKPANIMVGDDDEPTIMDFGIAHSTRRKDQEAVSKGSSGPEHLSRSGALIDDVTMAGAVIGTVEYMAPEQALGLPVDQRADIYAFGLIFYDMLVSGRRSKRADSPVAELQARMNKAPPAPRALGVDVPPAVDAMVARCLEPDPDKRFQTTTELQAALDRLDENGKPLPIIRRLTRRTMAAAAVVILLLLGGTFYVTKWLSAPVKEPDPVSVMIADVQNKTGDATFDNAITQTLKRALEDASFIRAYDRSKLLNLGVTRVPEKLDELAARELAVQQRVEVLLAGSIAPYRDGYEISVRALQTFTGNEIVNTSGRASNKDQVLETAAKLTARVRKVLGDRTSESDQLFAMMSISASSLEVVSQYAAGQEATARGKWEDARQRFSRAVELDPNFALGYQGLSATAAVLGQPDEAKKQIQEALRHVDGMTARERLFTRGAYYRLMRDWRNCAKEYGELLTRYPADTVARVQRSVCLVFLRRIREALAENLEAVKALPNNLSFRINLILTAYRAGEFQLVEAEVKAMQQPDARAVLALAYSQLGRGMLLEAAETYKRVAAVDQKNTYVQSGLGDLLVYEGRFSEAIPIFEQGAAADLAAKNTTRGAIKLLSAGYAHLLRGQSGQAAAAADKALQQSTVMAVRFLAAQIFVETAAIEKAQALAAELGKSTDPADDSRVYGKIIEAQIALKKKEPGQAIKLLTDANGVWDTWLGHFNLGRAYLEAGRFVEADSQFDLCITRRGEAITVMDEGPSYGIFPIVYYYQGRVREELKTANFADSYREYLRIRGESTEDPLVSEVRKRVDNRQ